MRLALVFGRVLERKRHLHAVKSPPLITGSERGCRTVKMVRATGESFMHAQPLVEQVARPCV